MTIIVGHGTWDCKISSQDTYCHNCERHHCRQHHRCTSVIMVWSPPGPPRTGHSTLVCCPLCLILALLVNCGGSTCDLCLMLECVITSLCDPTTRLLTLNGSALKFGLGQLSEAWTLEQIQLWMQWEGEGQRHRHAYTMTTLPSFTSLMLRAFVQMEKVVMATG